MPARQPLALVALAALACGGGERTPVTTTTSTLPPAPAAHDHTPHHGGVVGMAGDLHLEARAAADGTLAVFLTDLWRRPLAPARATGTVTLALPGGQRRLDLRPGGEALEAAGPPLDVPEVEASVALAVDGRRLEMDFLLPIASERTGAAGVPLAGCVPLASPPTAAAARPRCTLTFARSITALAAVRDGTLALVAGVDLGVSAWRLPAGRLVLGLAPPPPLAAPGPEGVRAHREAAAALATSPDGAEAVVALETRLLRYALASGRLAHELAAPGGVVRALAWAPDGVHLLVTAFYDAAAHLVRAADGVEVRRLPVDREGAAVAFAPDGRLAAVASEGGTITLFDLTGGAPPRALAAARGAVQALVFAGPHLLAAGDDGVVRAWDAPSGTLAGEAPTGRGLTRLALAPGGRVAASAGLDGIVRLHDAATGAVVATLAWHESQVLGLAWGGGVLVSGDLEGRVALWDAPDGVSPARPRGGSGSAP